MNYKEKYEQALEAIDEILNSGEDSIKMSRLKLCLQPFFPELRESEDERIRKEIIKYLSWLKDRDGSYMPNSIPLDDMITWLEKQESVGEIVERCKNSWYNEGNAEGERQEPKRLLCYNELWIYPNYH